MDASGYGLSGNMEKPTNQPTSITQLLTGHGGCYGPYCFVYIGIPKDVMLHCPRFTMQEPEPSAGRSVGTKNIVAEMLKSKESWQTEETRSTR